MYYSFWAKISVALVLLFFPKLSTSQTKISSSISFIPKTPIIDGQLDSDLSHLDIRPFNYIWQFDNPVTDTTLVTYRMAYTPSHLYLYIETDVDSVTYHRRGYLWGDGYKVLLGIPQNDTLTNEYYELNFSPTLEPDYEKYRQGISYYNFDQATKHLSPKTLSQEKSNNNTSGFEALIAWDDIKPYHPWFLDSIGFNLYFAKGIDTKEYDWITNGYSLVEDEGIWDEQIPKRNYLPIIFEDSIIVFNKVIRAQVKKKNLQMGEQLVLELAHIDKQVSQEALTIQFSSIDSDKIIKKTIPVHLKTTLQKEHIKLDLRAVKAGEYIVLVTSPTDTILQDLVAIRPAVDFQIITASLQKNEHNLELGTINTLQFELNQISNKLSNLKTYESGEAILKDWNEFEKKYTSYNAGIDPYKFFTKPYRRAFKSKYDDTYQPYSINIPKQYDSNKKYPLIVFLHGSGRDEQGMLDKPRSNGEFIEIAPLARDLYRAYSAEESQRDIIEAIEDVTKYFSVDTNQIIIGGFSMGGYGALRTYYEHPELYKGVAVFAGHPNIANEWLEGDYPNFSEAKYLSPFKDMPVFIYHGRKDPALDVQLIIDMNEKLKKAGAKTTLSIVEENGHQYQDDETNRLYYEWLENIINRK